MDSRQRPQRQSVSERRGSKLLPEADRINTVRHSQTESDSDILQELLWSPADPGGANLLADGQLTDWLKKKKKERLPASRLALRVSGKHRACRGGQAKSTARLGLHSNTLPDSQSNHLGLYWDVRRVERKLS